MRRSRRRDRDLTARDRTYLALVLVVLAIAMLLLVSCHTAPAAPREPSAAAVPVVKLDRPLGYCSAWVAEGGLVVTAGHCCDWVGQVLTLSGARSVPGARATVVVDDDEGDVCVLRGRASDAPGLAIAAADPDVGAYVWTAGYPMGYYLVSSGLWSGRVVGAGVASITVAPGASGGPLMDQRGRVVGVVSRYGWATIMLVAPVETLRAAVARAE